MIISCFQMYGSRSFAHVQNCPFSVLCLVLHYCVVLQHTFKLYVQIELYVVLMAQIQRTLSKFYPRNNLFPMLLFARSLCTSLALETVY